MLYGPPVPRPSRTAPLLKTRPETIVAVLNSERLCDKAPAELWATVLDEAVYLASVSTM